MDRPMNQHEGRRVDDTPYGRLVYFYPVFAGVFLAIMSLGGYIATLHYMGDHLKDHDRHLEKLDAWIETQSGASEERNNIMSRLTTIEASHEKRLDKIEDWLHRYR